MARRILSDAQHAARHRYEAELGSIAPLCPQARKLLSAEGFLDLFLEIRMLYPTYEEAYEMLEEQHERIIGSRMDSEYDSFRRGYLRWKTKNAHRSER